MPKETNRLYFSPRRKGNVMTIQTVINTMNIELFIEMQDERHMNTRDDFIILRTFCKHNYNHNIYVLVYINIYNGNYLWRSLTGKYLQVLQHPSVEMKSTISPSSNASSSATGHLPFFLIV